MSKYLFYFLFTFALLSCTQNTTKEENIEEEETPDLKVSKVIARGRTLFQSQCALCHALHQKLAGPPLAGVQERHDKEWLFKFIRNSQQMIQEGDKKAVAIYEEYNKVPMQSFNLIDADIEAILRYIESEGKP